MNESGPALKIIRQAGLKDSPGASGEQIPYTYPSDSTITSWRGTIDWQFHRGPVQVLQSETVDFVWNGVVPSDHKPVLVTYRLFPSD